MALSAPARSRASSGSRTDSEARETVDLTGFFDPRRVAVLGASESSGWTRYLVDSLDRSPGLDAVALVNPRHPAVLGRPTVPRLAALDEVPDLAFVQVGADQVLPVIGEALDLGVRDFVVLSAGFGEVGGDGAGRQRQLGELCQAYGARLLGPNVSGFVHAAGGVRVFGLPAPSDLPVGRIGVALQSGGLATHVLSLARAWGIGLSLMATSGNEACLDATDLFSYLVDDPHTDAIAVFLESIRRPAAFTAAALRAAAIGKPVVALHVGRSALGRAAALAHTGALVGDHDSTTAALADLGVVTVDSLENLMCTTALLARHPGGLAGRRLAVVAASGGACELIADAAEATHLTLPAFRPELVEGLAAALPGFAEPHNPLDVTGFVVKAADLPFTATELVGRLAPRDYDVLILQSVVLPAEPGGDADQVDARFARLAEAIARSPLPVVLQTAATFALSPFALELVTRHRLVVLPGIAAGISALAAAARLAELRPAALRTRGADDSPAPPAGPPDVIDAAIDVGLAVPPHRLVTDADQAVVAATEIGFPVALKIDSPDLPHKSDVGGVALDLRDAAAVRSAHHRMVDSVTRARPDARIRGVEVVALRRPVAELLVSVVRDPQWGPMLTVGAGGVLTELWRDVITRPLPLDDAAIAEMIGRLRIDALLAGYRGLPGADRAAVVAAVRAVIRLFHRLGPDVRAVEVNPLGAQPDRAEALDLLVEFATAEDRDI